MGAYRSGLASGFFRIGMRGISRESIAIVMWEFCC